MPLEDTGPEPQVPSRTSELRQLTDAQTMRALAHPVRIELMEALSLHGPLTATEVGELIGESATTCSFHLRQLAKYGFVEEAGGGKGRSRPWKMSSIGLRMSSSSFQDDPDAAMAAGVLAGMVRDRQLKRYQTWLQTRTTFPQEWQNAASDSEFVSFVTADELRALNDEISDLLLARFQDRFADPSKRPAGARPVEILFMSYPFNSHHPKGDPS